LAHASGRPYRSEAITEFVAETQQINFHPSADCGLQASCLPPNQITGSFGRGIAWVNDPTPWRYAG
jgi:hypothetical protein